MTNHPEQRGSRRFLVAERLGARAGASLEVRLMDLSLSGARIEHQTPLRAGATCFFEFPPALASLVLSARVVHSTASGGDARAEGDPTVRYQSGLAFVDLTPDQQVALAAVLGRLTSLGSLQDHPQAS